MARLISVVTPVHAPTAEYLPEAHRSLRAQELPEGWDWQWVIQTDGEPNLITPHVPDDSHVDFGQGRRGGPGVARTLALARAHGEYVRVLDADDVLAPGALARDIGVLTDYPDIGWCTSRVLDLMPDGTTAAFGQDPPEGPIDTGVALAHWRAHDHTPHVSPATLCVRRRLLLALGGWPALPASEDVGLLLGLNVVARGWFSRDVGLLSRKWAGQASNQPAYTHEGERAARMAVIEARVTALADLLT